MLPTPSTSHVCFDTIYEPAEDSYLLLDTLSSTQEAAWLSSRFNHGADSEHTQTKPSPLVVEVGTGSGVVLAFVAANARHIIGRSDILTLGVDVNRNACDATKKTVKLALEEKRRPSEHQNDSISSGDVEPQIVAAVTGDLCTPLRAGIVDFLIFNPPYVPTPELPLLPSSDPEKPGIGASKFEQESHLLSLSYAGGEHGMGTTNRLLEELPHILNPDRGVAYVLLCAQNNPHEVMARIRTWGPDWNAEIVGRSGVKAGWERLVIVRIWKERIL